MALTKDQEWDITAMSLLHWVKDGIKHVSASSGVVMRAEADVSKDVYKARDMAKENSMKMLRRSQE